MNKELDLTVNYFSDGIDDIITFNVYIYTGHDSLNVREDFLAETLVQRRLVVSVDVLDQGCESGSALHESLLDNRQSCLFVFIRRHFVVSITYSQKKQASRVSNTFL